jgi:hypothetical protein
VKGCLGPCDARNPALGKHCPFLQVSMLLIHQRGTTFKGHSMCLLFLGSVICTSCSNSKCLDGWTWRLSFFFSMSHSMDVDFFWLDG